MRSWLRFAAGVERLLDVLLGAMLLVMVLAIAYQVFGRYVLGQAPSWGEELARYLMVWMTMLGSAAELRNGGHITVTAVADRLPRRWLGLLLTLRDICVCATCGLLVDAGIELASIMHRQSSPAFEIPVSIPYAAQPVGFALILLLVAVARLGRQPFHLSVGEAF